MTTKRRGKMLMRAILWTLGAVLGFYFRKLTGGQPHVEGFVMFWVGMMLAAIMVHLDPPEIQLWEPSA
jgi:zinc transporter ZupT